MRLRCDDEGAGARLDQYLHSRLPSYSRSRLQQWIKDGRVLVNGQVERAARPLRDGDVVDVDPAVLPPLKATAEAMPLDILYEDADVVVVNKPAGMVVHAGAGVHSGTLVNALLYHFQTLSHVGGDLRPGIVHRLDRFTSGVLVVAKNDGAHQSLAEQFSSRTVEKTYVALVHGKVKQDHGRIEKPIARDPVRRVRMTARLERGRSARSEYFVLKRFDKHTLLEVHISTGRTHQIRVHLASLGHPVAGDRLYGAPAVAGVSRTPGRFFLHAQRMRFTQPSTGHPVEVMAPLPEELQHWMDGLPPEAIIKT